MGFPGSDETALPRSDETAFPGSDWMQALGAHHDRMRRAHPGEQLCVVFDIDGTILDMRYLVAHALGTYDREHGTDHFRGLRPDDIRAHETRIDEILMSLGVPADLRPAVADWYRDNLWREDAARRAHRPFPGVLGVIRWFQLQPDTVVALNTGRPESMRARTLETLNTLGRAYRVEFPSHLMCMNPHGAERYVSQAKTAGLRRLRAMGLRVVAVVDNEPANIHAMARDDTKGDVLFLHAETLFTSERVPHPRVVGGSSYDLGRLIPEEELGRRVQLVWHGVNDDANLRQFLASGIGWAEVDVRSDPAGRLVLRHDSYEESPWDRSEQALLLEDALGELRARGRSVKIDLKEAGAVADRTLASVHEAGFEDEALWFNGEIDIVGSDGFRRLRRSRPRATISCPVDALVPLVAALPRSAARALRRAGVDRLSVRWGTPNLRGLVDRFEGAGWDVNVYAVPDLAGFLEATLLLPRSVTADFNFPEWNYFGRGAGEGRAYHGYELSGSHVIQRDRAPGAA